MIRLTDEPVFLTPQGERVQSPSLTREQGLAGTMAWRILEAHNQSGDMNRLQLRFDALVSPDNNYVSILQTARASGLTHFPVPYVLSNCHNTLCGVGGTINEDDHRFGLDNVRRYGGIFVPRYRAVLHQYMRERMACSGGMILGSDSHTRYGALGCMGIGEGGGEVVKQLLGRTYDLARPPILAVVLRGSCRPGIGPMDVALTLIGAVFQKGFCKNRILEFIGPGVQTLSAEMRMGIDVMSTESAALSSVWTTDGKIRDWLELHGRGDAYRPMEPAPVACYDGMIEIDLDQVECMMALPFHPSHAVPISEFKKDPARYLRQVEEEGSRIKGAPFRLTDKLREDGLHIDQALVSGCAGGMFENLSAMADILEGQALSGGGVFLGINPASQPVMHALMTSGVGSVLSVAGAVVRPSMCGPCFGVSDIPADGQLSIRHVTRNYANREGSKPGAGQMAAVILMDARSIAATVRNGGVLTAATELDVVYKDRAYPYERRIYENQVFDCFGQADERVQLRMGPNIAPWPAMRPYARHLLLRVAGVYEGSVTTDELVPSGDATAYRSNPGKISEYTLISRDPGYRERAKRVRDQDDLRARGEALTDAEAEGVLSRVCAELGCSRAEVTLGSVIVADEIGDGSSREQAASNQKVLGGFANLAGMYSTKRYRSNLINWGILPVVCKALPALRNGDYLLIEDVRGVIERAGEDFVIRRLGGESLTGNLGAMTPEEKDIVRSGCLINYYRR